MANLSHLAQSLLISFFLPVEMRDPLVLRSNGDFYFLDKAIEELSDGQWLVEIENKVSIRELAFIPVKKGSGSWWRRSF
ncbi:hypothetical protein LDO48_17840 [Pantoea agglomerans]|nr:hypothetical protein [Pantoea agglomerans]